MQAQVNNCAPVAASQVMRSYNDSFLLPSYVTFRCCKDLCWLCAFSNLPQLATQISSDGESCLHIKDMPFLPEMGHMQTQLIESALAFSKSYTVETPYGQYIILK